MWAYRDIVERVGEFVDGIVVPQAGSPGDVERVDTLVGMIELDRRSDIHAAIATAQALALLDEIALASDRLDALVLDDAGLLAMVGSSSPRTSSDKAPGRQPDAQPAGRRPPRRSWRCSTSDALCAITQHAWSARRSRVDRWWGCRSSAAGDTSCGVMWRSPSVQARVDPLTDRNLRNLSPVQRSGTGPQRLRPQLVRQPEHCLGQDMSTRRKAPDGGRLTDPGARRNAHTGGRTAG